MAPFRYLDFYNTTSSTYGGLTHGFVPSPNGRGTADILQSCLVTVLLCSWSVLFLNVPARKDGRWARVRTQGWWMLFTLFFPEMITGIAAEQWRSADQSVQDFKDIAAQWETGDTSDPSRKEAPSMQDNIQRYRASPWTMRHAFFADMGGILLQFPNYPSFPVDAQQLAFLIGRGYLEYPTIESSDIWDRNKADTAARAVTLIQIAWFIVQAVGRGIQHLKLSTFELSTIAFIFCTFNSFFFFRHKPRDVETAITLKSEVTIAHIEQENEVQPRASYTQTPLDFVKSSNQVSLIAPFWFAIRICFDWSEAPERPIKCFGNSRTTPPRGIYTSDIIYGVIFCLGYFGIHLIGWHFHFPTRIEQFFWRICTLLLLGLMLLYMVLVAFGMVFARHLARLVFGNHQATTLLEVAGLLPRTKAVMLHLPVIAIYCLARGYIVLEGFVSLRALPPSLYASISWFDYVPHI